MITFRWYQFSELTLEQLYAALALRADVFVLEQHCLYLDLDGKDLGCLHLLGMTGNKLAAYLRLFPPQGASKDLVFGRVVTARFARGKGYGKKLMEEMLRYCTANYPRLSIRCSAQLYLKQFYEDFGFTTSGDVYDEDGIPHIAMKKDF